MTVDVAIGLDMGSTSIKVLAATLGGGELLVLHNPSPWRTIDHDCTEMSADDVLESVFDLLHRAGTQLEKHHGDYCVVGIGVSGMAEAGVLLSSDGVVAAPIIAWFDPRGAIEIRATPQRFQDEFSGRTGLPVGPIATIAKLLYLKGTGVELSGKRWLNVPEYVAHVLGGQPRTEYSLASRTGLLDQDNGEPWRAALDLLAVDDDFLPERCNAGDALGVARHPSLPAGFLGAALAIAGHDHLVSAVAAGARSSDQLYDSIGTAEALVRILDEQLPFEARERLALAGVNSLRHVMPGKYALLAATKAGLLMGRAFQVLGISESSGRQALDEATMALPVEGNLAPGSIEVTGARNDDGVMRVRVNADGASPAELFTATLLHGNDMCAELIEAMNLEVPAATSCLLTGGWARMKSVSRARGRLFPHTSNSHRTEDTAFGAALFGAYAAEQRGVVAPADRFARFAAEFCGSAPATAAHQTPEIHKQGAVS